MTVGQTVVSARRRTKTPREIVTHDLSGLAERINEEHRAAVVGHTDAVSHAFEAGRLLLEAKKNCGGHGRWLPWLAENFEGSEDTAQRYIRVARANPNTARMRDLSINLLLEGISRSEQKAKKQARRENHAESIRNAAKISQGGVQFEITDEQRTVSCDALITDPPYGILDEPWEPERLEEFTRDWSSRWSRCGADSIAVFWSQRHLWSGRQWFDESFSGYAFQQLLIWHYANNKSPQSRAGFKQTWEPIFFYRRVGSERGVKIGEGDWGDGINDFDCHVAAVPQSNFNGAECKQHPAQKPVSVMRWLVAALTTPGELVADPFCGSGTTGIAAVQLGRRFRGIEIDEEYRALAAGRLEKFGK